MFLQLPHVLNSVRARKADQRAGCLAIEVVKLLVKLLMKLYQTGPYLSRPFRNQPTLPHGFDDCRTLKFPISGCE
jgi:hypothetical protein